MIISHTYKYLFVELPRTGTTAISRELCQNYDGIRILRKHSTYHDFLKVATPDEKEYFVFSCIRNPLDDAVSRYFKLKNDHGSRYTDPVKLKKRKSIGERVETFIFNSMQRTNADFQSFFMKYYIFPYNNWASMGRAHYDYVIHFEHIQDDFCTALELIGIEPVRPLPIRNATSARKRQFTDYYTPAAIRRAKRVFGPFMKQWGYDFPVEWGNGPIPWWDQLEFDFFNLFRLFFWKYLRYRI
jgi:hypothetical protein